jgi:anti-sigma regulatory factor (Ser/Thr protein kinase)
MTIDTRARVEPRDHVVLFYDDDTQLVRTVARYLFDGLTADENVVVVATATHVEAIEATLGRAGIDVVDARSTGQLVMIDAAEAMSRFMVDGWPDQRAFNAEMGELVRRAGGSSGRLRVFGEMVALMWEAGHVSAAVELEALWNELGREAAFSLFCAYRAQSVIGDDHGESFRHLCHCHSAVVGGVPMAAQSGHGQRAEAARSFRGEASELGAVRQFVVDTLLRWGHDRHLENASIVVSELATNAITHARSDFIVSMSSSHGSFRLSVRDTSTTLPSVRAPLPTTMSGRGLLLIGVLAQRWGTEIVADGKVVWVEFCP